MAEHPCQRCGSDEWEYVDYGGCSKCRPREERESEDRPSDPTAIEGTWTDLESHARYTYWLETATQSEHDLSEAVLVLLGATSRDAVSREAALALIKDAQRWEAAYRGERDALAGLRQVAKRDYLRLAGLDRTLETTRVELAAEREEVERVYQVLADLRDDCVDAATHSTDALARERLLAAAERAR